MSGRWRPEQQPRPAAGTVHAMVNYRCGGPGWLLFRRFCQRRTVPGMEAAMTAYELATRIKEAWNLRRGTSPQTEVDCGICGSWSSAPAASKEQRGE
ncbi:hypothetical protein [Streptomyces lutosisoli]|uniref:hypothetical protein n=1 Tax=Streptomyces lutosisoli TaxID=2665721 RepID=UPI00360D5484